MKTISKNYVLPAIILAMIVTAFAFYAFTNNLRTATGSTIQGNDYFSTTTDSVDASSTLPMVIKPGAGSLSMITVLQADPSRIIKFYDHPYATGTMPNGQRGSQGVAVSTSSLILTFPAGVATGTYTFDIGFGTGITADVPASFTGQYVISYR